MKTFRFDDLCVTVNVKGAALANIAQMPKHIQEDWARDMAILSLNGARPDLGVRVIDDKNEEKRLAVNAFKTDADRRAAQPPRAKPVVGTPTLPEAARPAPVAVPECQLMPAGTMPKVGDRGWCEKGQFKGNTFDVANIAGDTVELMNYIYSPAGHVTGSISLAFFKAVSGDTLYRVFRK